MARRKGAISERYPIVFNGAQYGDVESAWFGLKASEKDGDQLMVRLIACKLLQNPQLQQAITERGGVAWLEKCSHFTNAKSDSFKAWEGTGRASRFIRNLIGGYERACKQPGLVREDALPMQNDLFGTLETDAGTGRMKP